MKTVTEVLAYLQKTLKAPKRQKNDFANYNYRSAEDILEAVKPIMPEGYLILLSDKINHIGDRYYVEATATIIGGGGKIEVTASAREANAKKGMDDAQITGAASSYARKYALSGLLAIDDTKDADTQNNNVSHDDMINPESEYFDAKVAATHTKQRLMSFKEVGGLIVYFNEKKVQKRMNKIYEESSSAANHLVGIFEQQRERLNSEYLGNKGSS